MRNQLPKTGPYLHEKAIINLEEDETHWVAYTKYGKRIDYFDSFRNVYIYLHLFNLF